MKSRKKLIIQTIQTQKNKQKAVQRIVNSDTALFSYSAIIRQFLKLSTLFKQVMQPLSVIICNSITILR